MPVKQRSQKPQSDGLAPAIVKNLSNTAEKGIITTKTTESLPGIKQINVKLPEPVSDMITLIREKHMERKFSYSKKPPISQHDYIVEAVILRMREEMKKYGIEEPEELKGFKADPIIHL